IGYRTQHRLVVKYSSEKVPGLLPLLAIHDIGSHRKVESFVASGSCGLNDVVLIKSNDADCTGYERPNQPVESGVVRLIGSFGKEKQEHGERDNKHDTNEKIVDEAT